MIGFLLGFVAGSVVMAYVAMLVIDDDVARHESESVIGKKDLL